MKHQRLSEIENGQWVKVHKIESSDLRIKLLEMGFIEGKNLHVLFRAPFGDPMAVDVQGYVLSLRNDEADLITVEQTSPFS